MDFDPDVVPAYTESLRLCGNWLAETCLESPGVILEKYLERVRWKKRFFIHWALFYQNRAVFRQKKKKKNQQFSH